MNFDNYLFHPSALGEIMTDDRSGKNMGETCKKKLLECWIEATYGRTKEFTNKYMEKGTLMEEDSITLYSLVTKKFHKKNLEQIKNGFFIGTPDLYDGKDIYHVEVIKDIKTSWDIFTFYEVLHKPVNKHYIWQLQAYMDLTGAEEAGLVYCLVDTPLHLIDDAKRKLQWAMNVIDPEANPEFQAKCEQIEKNMTFSLDIPKEKRYIEFKIERNDEMIREAHSRIFEARKFMNELSLKP